MKPRYKTIPAMIALAILILLSQMATAIPFVCFADGEVFNQDESPVMNGTKITITNTATNETIKTATGYPRYPPIPQYDNDYKSAFTCQPGIHELTIRAENETHYGTANIVVPQDSQALANITLNHIIIKDEYDDNRQEKGLLDWMKKIVKYFARK